MYNHFYKVVFNTENKYVETDAVPIVPMQYLSYR